MRKKQYSSRVQIQHFSTWVQYLSSSTSLLYISAYKLYVMEMEHYVFGIYGFRRP